MFERRIFQVLFLPISLLWQKVYEFRRFLYHIGFLKSVDFSIPVISVGNLSFGGTGKTPLTIWLCEFLKQENKKTVVLTRGYKSKKENTDALISGKQDDPNAVIEFGDEATMMAGRLEGAHIIVGKNRKENIIKYFNKVKPNALILDDGYQHLKISRSTNIVLFDALMPLYKYATPPLGYLREGLRALDDADFIIIGRTDQTSRAKVDQVKQLILENSSRDFPFAEFRYVCEGIYDNNYKKVGGDDYLKDRKICALSAIASPESFYNMIEHHGGRIIEKFSFSDHYFFTEKDIEQINSFSLKENAIILTTEKDFVKIKALAQDHAVYFLKINLEFLSGEVELKKHVMKNF